MWFPDVTRERGGERKNTRAKLGEERYRSPHKQDPGRKGPLQIRKKEESQGIQKGRKIKVQYAGGGITGLYR